MQDKLIFLIQNLKEKREKIEKNLIPSRPLFSGYELEKEKKAFLSEANLKNVLKIKPGQIIVTNQIKLVLPLKITGKKVIYITINPIKDFSRKKTLKEKLLYLYYKLNYNLCDRVIVLSKYQERFLNSKGIRKTKVIPLGADAKLLKKQKLSRKYFLSAGGDKGRNYEFIKEISKKIPIKILGEKSPVSYKEYLKVLAGAKALVFNINPKRKHSSDISGTSVSSEGLLMKKPIFINPVPWAKELFKENCHIYSTEEELMSLLKKDIPFKEIDYSYLDIRNFGKELIKIGRQLKHNS